MGRNAQLIRQWAILKQIETNRWTTITDLADSHVVSTKTIRRDLAALLEATRLSHGTCRLGDAIAGDGNAASSFLLACDHGPLELSLSLADGRIDNVSLSQPDDAACVP